MTSIATADTMTPTVAHAPLGRFILTLLHLDDTAD